MSDIAEVKPFSDVSAEQKWEAPAAQDEDDEAAILAAMATVKQHDAALEAQLPINAGRGAFDSSSDDEVHDTCRHSLPRPRFYEEISCISSMSCVTQL